MKKSTFLFSVALVAFILCGVSCSNELMEQPSFSGNSVVQKERGAVTASLFVPDWQKMSEEARIIAPQTKKVSLLYKRDGSWGNPISFDFDAAQLEVIEGAPTDMPGGIWRGTFSGIPAGVYEAGELKVELSDATGKPITAGASKVKVEIKTGEKASGSFFTVPNADMISSKGTLKKGEMGFWEKSISPGWNYEFEITASPSYPDVVLFNGDGIFKEYKAIDSAQDANFTLFEEKDSALYYIGFYADEGDVEYSVTVKEPPLGEMHPATGAYSPVKKGEWSSTTQSLKGGSVLSNGNMCVSIYSANATKILLEIYDKNYGVDATYDYWMEKCEGGWWRAEINSVPDKTLYAFRAWGPNWKYNAEWKRGSDVGFESDCDADGNRFNPNKVLYDPYAREMTHDVSNEEALQGEKTTAIMTSGEANRNKDSGKYAPKSILISDSTSTGTKPGIAQKDAIIYEAHVRGLTRHPSSARLQSILSGFEGFEGVQDVPSQYAGTYKGATYMIPYLKGLGINTVEFLPVHETDNDANPDDNPGGNYWGYMTFSYFAPDRRYSYDKTPGGPTREFKEMVKAFHDAGMEVYLDVVYNHSGEGGTWQGDKDNGEQCTLVSMRGLDNATYYALVQGNKSYYWETTGCGNNLQCDNPYVRQFILDSLTYWTDEMGVDGFRFDLAPVIGREFNESTGNWDYNADSQILKDIAALGDSRNAEMIAEAWDIGAYGVGTFPSGWGEWNGRYRDALRGYVGGGNRGSVNDFINGDYNYFNDQGGPHKSVNFIVAHDGFTLADLCSYTGSGNAQNGQLTWPFGPSDGGNGDNNQTVFGEGKPARRQANRNYSTIQMISRGVPMIVWGDEFCRTQNGNNNPYNIDSVATWNNYTMINTDSPHTVSTEAQGDYHNNFGTFGNSDRKNGNFVFMQYLMKLREREAALRQTDYTVGYDFKKENGVDSQTDGDACTWLRINGSRVGGDDYLVFMNMWKDAVDFAVPAENGCEWKRIVDTCFEYESKYNCWTLENADTITTETYGVQAYSVVILERVLKEGAEVVATPVISGEAEFDASVEVTITCATQGATIYYTTDGKDPTEASTKYESPITLTSSATVKAMAILEGNINSAVASKEFKKNGEKTVRLTTTYGTQQGQAVYFIGTFNESENWGKAVRGDWSTGNVWGATVTYTEGETFVWKPVVFAWSEDKTTVVPTTGAIWPSGDNAEYPGTTDYIW